MLILTRKVGEAISIGENIKVMVLGVFGNQVRIGIEAPPEIAVHREEVYLQIQHENERASDSDPEKINAALSKLKGAKESSDAPVIVYRKERKNGNYQPNIGKSPFRD